MAKRRRVVVKKPAADAQPRPEIVRAKRIQDKMREGKPVTPMEVAHLDAALEGVGPAGVAQAGAPPEGGEIFGDGGLDDVLDSLGAPPRPPPPDDVLVTTAKALAVLSGLHENTIGNYKKRCIEPLGSRPWSLKAWYLLLRQNGLLGETKPRDKRAQAMRAWAFGNGDATDPNDPAHLPPVGWGDERSRQGALKDKAQRQQAEIELQTMQRERIPIEEYRKRWAARAQQVLVAIEGFMSVVKDVPDLTEPQRVALNKLLREKIRDVRARIAPPKKGAAHGPR
jgi:hypothetical protein